MADIAELIVALRLQDGVSGGLGRLNGQLRGMQGGLSQVGRGIGQVGTGLDRIATRGAIAAATGLTAVVTAAVSFEDAFAGVRKTVDATESEFDSLEGQLREMARTMPISFEELAGITEQGGALGIAFDALDEFTKTVADLANTTDLTADQAATSLGVLGNVLGLSAEDFDNFGSALVDLGNKGASTESAIIDIAERVGATGDLIGLSADQVLGFGSAVANLGIEAEAGGSALQRFFLDALTAVESGGAELETFARTAGVSAESFRDSFREDAGAALADFIEGLGQLPEAVQIQTLQDLGFNDVRISRTLLGLAGDAENLTDSLAISAEAFAANSALGEEAAKRYGTAASQIKILKNNVTDAAVVIGEQLLPIVADLTTELVGWLNDPDTQRGIREFGENLASGIRDFITEVKKADFGPLLDTLKGAAGVAKAAFDAFLTLPAPVQQLAIAALVANKVTGGAVGSIAAGLANILKGSMTILFERGSTPANPLWVQQVGGPGGTGPVGGGGLGSFLAGAAAIGAGVAAGLAVGVPIFRSIVDPAKDFEQSQIDRIIETGDPSRIREGIQILDDEIKRLSELPPQAREAWRGVIDILKEQRAALATELAPLGPPLGFHPKFTLRPGFSEARNVGDRPPVLPDTAMQPLIGALDRFTQAVERNEKAPTPTTDRPFVETVKLDPSQVTDLRKETAQAAKELRTLTADARAADQANRTSNAFQTAEAIKTRTETVTRLTTLAAKYDAANAKLDGANRQLGVIAAKNPVHPVTVNNSITIPVSISATLLEQRLVTAYIAKNATPTSPTEIY